MSVTPSKWPSYDPARDGNVFRWINQASAAVRDNRQQERPDHELPLPIEQQARINGNHQKTTRSKKP